VVDATLPHIPDVFADLIRIMRLSGMRPGEALFVSVEQFDRSDPECWIYRPGTHMTEHRGRTRAVFLGPKCQAILSPWILKAGAGRIFPLTASGFHTAINRACDRAFLHPTLSRIDPAKLTGEQRARPDAGSSGPIARWCAPRGTDRPGSHPRRIGPEAGTGRSPRLPSIESASSMPSPRWLTRFMASPPAEGCRGRHRNLTGVEPQWLLDGRGAKYRDDAAGEVRDGPDAGADAPPIDRVRRISRFLEGGRLEIDVNWTVPERSRRR
jgi:hypothetical protein